MVAQALLEKGMLDSLVSGLSGAATGIATSVQDQPWLWGAAIALCLLLLLRAKRR